MAATVKFADTVEVKEMSIDKEAHKEELRNPAVTVVDPSKIADVVEDVVDTPEPKKSNIMFAVLILILIIFIAFITHRSGSQRERLSDNKNDGEEPLFSTSNESHA
jgi:transcriptional regulatory protein LevR